MRSVEQHLKKLPCLPTLAARVGTSAAVSVRYPMPTARRRLGSSSLRRVFPRLAAIAPLLLASWLSSGCSLYFQALQAANQSALRPDGQPRETCTTEVSALFDDQDENCREYSSVRGCTESNAGFNYAVKKLPDGKFINAFLSEVRCTAQSCDPGQCAPGKAVGAAGLRPEPVPVFLPGDPIVAAATVSTKQRNALLALYTSTNGGSWWDRTGWGGAAGTECSWHGVVCSDDGATVVGLWFDRNNLGGSIPAQLRDLVDLEVVYIANFGPLSFEPGFWSHPNLRSLHLEDLPWTTLPPEIGNLPGLQTLELVDLASLGALPATLGRLRSLTQLRLEELPQVKALPPKLGDLTALRTLVLRQTGVTGVGSVLANLTALRTLAITDSPDFAGPFPPVGSLSQLTILVIEETSIEAKIPPALANLKLLEVLSLRGNPGLSGPIPPGLGTLGALQVLRLPANDLEGRVPSSLGNLAKLERLDLSFNRLVGALPESLGNLTKLRTLVLTNNGFTGPLPPLASMPQLSLLSAGANELSGPLPGSLGKRRELRVLFLRSNKFSGPIPNLSGLPNLTHLNLSDNPFAAGPVPAWVGTLPAIQNLALAGTNRTGSPPNLSALASRLTYLGLDDNTFVAGPVPAWIANLTKLTGLGLANTNRTGAIPRFLTGMEQLQHLDLSGNPFTPSPIPGFFSSTETPRLRELDLSRTRRTGRIPAALWTLSLSRLRLAGNQLEGPLSQDVHKPLLLLLDLSDNRLGGTLPSGLSTQVRMGMLRLDGNKFTGPVPSGLKSSVMDDDMIDGPLVSPYGEELIGIDLRYNSLTTSDAETIALVKQKEGDDFRLTQTVAPKGGAAAPSGKGSLRVTWTPIAFVTPGSYVLQKAPAAAGPFTTAATIASRSTASFTLSGLPSGKKVFFRLLSVTPPHAENPNRLESAPSAVFSGTPQ